MLKLTVITGPMFSGKSMELIRRLKNAEYAKKKILAIKPNIRRRITEIGEGEIVARFKFSDKFERLISFPAYPISSENDFWNLIKNNPFDFLGIDEAHLFDYWFYATIEELIEENCKRDIEILVAGLDMDAWRRPFGLMGNLMAQADEVIKMKAICFNCGEPAIFTQKIGGSSKQIIEIGDYDIYQARCRACHTLPQ